MRLSGRWIVTTALLVAGCLAAPRVALAAPGSIAIALASELRSVDPHRAATPADEVIASHVFESLVGLGSDFGPTPVLATGWTQPQLNTWQFQLRRNVRFHDGSLLSADDVVASIRRAIRLKPSVVLGGKPEWLTVDVVDRHTIRVRAEPTYAFPLNVLARIQIASAASLKALDGGGPARALAAGTGPYRIRGSLPERVDVVVHKQYWREPPQWEALEFHAMPDTRKRLAAIRSNQVDVVERVPFDEADSLRKDQHFAMHQAATGRLMYLQFGTHATDAPYVGLAEAVQPAPNPLLDRRVRRAISQAIDRIELTRTVLQGMGEPAGQLVPAGYLGHVSNLYPDKHDVADARALLTEAGFPSGFSLTLHGPQNVYPGDVAVLTAVARMLGEVGIRAQAVSEPAATFASRGQRQQYSAYLRGFAGTARDASEYLVALLARYDPHSGAGHLNWARYSNGTLDGMLQRAVTQPRLEARNLMLQEATRVAMNDVALVPLYFSHDAWLARGGIQFAQQAADMLLAERLTPARPGARQAQKVSGHRPVPAAARAVTAR